MQGVFLGYQVISVFITKVLPAEKEPERSSGIVSLVCIFDPAIKKIIHGCCTRVRRNLIYKLKLL